MSLVIIEGGALGLICSADVKAIDAYHKGRRTLIHLPVEWVDSLEPKAGWPDGMEKRALGVGDKIGLYSAPFPRARMADIERMEVMNLRSMSVVDLAALGRRDEDDLEGYKESWNQCWGSGHPSDPRAWPWEQNPKVYAIYWKPIGITVRAQSC